MSDNMSENYDDIYGFEVILNIIVAIVLDMHQSIERLDE